VFHIFTTSVSVMCCLPTTVTLKILVHLHFYKAAVKPQVSNYVPISAFLRPCPVTDGLKRT